MGPKWLGNGPVPEIRTSQRQVEHISATGFNNWYDAKAFSGRLFQDGFFKVAFLARPSWPTAKFADRSLT
jgi:hypothetical protein